MAYAVEIMPRAERDLAAVYAAINAEESDAALRWFRGLERWLLTLQGNPARCPPIPEDRHLRHLLYGKKPYVYRIIFQIDEPRKVVQILTRLISSTFSISRTTKSFGPSLPGRSMPVNVAARFSIAGRSGEERPQTARTSASPPGKSEPVGTKPRLHPSPIRTLCSKQSLSKVAHRRTRLQMKFS